MRFTRDQKEIIVRAYRMKVVTTTELAQWANTSPSNIKKARGMGLVYRWRQRKKQERANASR